MPWITLPEPKYPLTESEKKWLEKRKVGMCCRCVHYYTDITDCGIGCQWIANKDFPMLQCFRFRHEDYTIEKGDWADAAEFEARVAAKLTGLNAAELPCYPNFLCPFSAKHLGMGCKDCFLKHARLVVEEEIENGRTV